MKCPECGKECRKGFIEAKNGGSITQLFTSMLWCPEDENGTKLKKETVDLKLHGEGWYCDECMKIFASFAEK